MRLFEAIIDANHRAVAGDTMAGLRPAEHADSLPIVALTCIDPRLNAYFPNALALPAEEFIWLRNAGNVITSTMSSTMRSLALACAVKGGREIAVIGHTDCLVGKTTTMQLLDRLKALGVDRSWLPENINEFFGMFGSERQNVIKACDFVRSSPLIGPKIPVHGLLLDIENGNLEWIVNGYNAPASAAVPAAAGQAHPETGGPFSSIGAFKDFAMGEMKFPESKIGEAAARAERAIAAEASQVGSKIGQAIQTGQNIAEEVTQYAEKNWPKPPVIPDRFSPLPPKKNPLPPPVRPRAKLHR